MLGATTRVEDHRHQTVSAQHWGHPEGIVEVVGAPVIHAGQPEFPEAVGFDDGRQVHPPLSGLQLGNVDDPDLVQPSGVQHSFHRVDRLGVSVIDDGGRPPLLRADPPPIPHVARSRPRVLRGR